MKKNVKAVMMYMMPSCLWSVVVSIFHAKPPFGVLPEGAGLSGTTLWSSRGATAVIQSS